MTAILTTESGDEIVAHIRGMPLDRLPSGNVRSVRPNVRESGADFDYWASLSRGGIYAGLIVSVGVLQPAPAFDSDVRLTRAITPARSLVWRKDDEMEHSATPTPEASIATNSTPDIQLAEIQEALSLPTTDVADILGVSRTAVYGYINGTTTSPNDKTAERLRQLHQIARSWRDLSEDSMGRLWGVVISDDVPSLVSQLREAEWDEARLMTTLRELALIAQERAERQRELRERGFGRLRQMPPEDRELRRVEDILRFGR